MIPIFYNLTVWVEPTLFCAKDGSQSSESLVYLTHTSHPTSTTLTLLNFRAASHVNAHLRCMTTEFWLFPVQRVFWIGPLFGGVLAAVAWEGVLRPEQPVVRFDKTVLISSI